MQPPNKQQGMMLIMLVFILGLIVTSYLLHALNPGAIKIERDKKTVVTLAEAKIALLSYVLTKPAGNIFGYFPNPDLGQINFLKEGDSAETAGDKNAIVIGKLPWRSLGISPLKDGANECLWYIVSGHFKNNPKTGDALNWDTQGQIDVVDKMGNVIKANLTALIVSPGGPLSSQNRTRAIAEWDQCGGNYDARNYLDPFSAEVAIDGEVNYFINTPNNSRAPNTNNKQFVLINNVDYNDRFLFVTVDDIFSLINRRSDFSAHINALLDDADFKAHLQAVSINGNKGTKEVECNKITNADNQKFCSNWIEMFLLTELSVATPIAIDGIATAPCSRVLIFGGQKTGTQVRSTANDKADPANYLEAVNLEAFDVPKANSSNFIGTSSFNAGNSGADLLRCL